jgi:RES domain-containing protein
MTVYRICKSRKRANDLSGLGAFLAGGRWNNTGNFAVYTSESQSLAMLEVLVHLEEIDLPPDLYVVTIDIDEKASVYEVRDNELPDDRRAPGNLELMSIGDKLLITKKYVAFRVRSAVMPDEYNVVLNPTHADFGKHISVEKIEKLKVDERLKR